jgi:hypothetical protein
MKHAYKRGRLIGRPDEARDELPEIVPGLHVKIGIRGKQEIGGEWPWAVVRRVLDGRIWVAVDYTIFAEDHGIESGDELEVRREEIHEARTLEDIHREAAVMRRFFLSAGELARDVDRHLKFGTVPTTVEMARWVQVLEDIAEYHESVAGPKDPFAGDAPPQTTPSGPGTAA